jgi:hypothetical protein
MDDVGAGPLLQRGDPTLELRSQGSGRIFPRPFVRPLNLDCAIIFSTACASARQDLGVLQAGRIGSRSACTRADITLFGFDAAGAPAVHVRCRRYRVDGRHTLRKTIAVCEAMQLLTSPDSLGGTERQREMNFTECIGKESASRGRARQAAVCAYWRPARRRRPDAGACARSRRGP